MKLEHVSMINSSDKLDHTIRLTEFFRAATLLRGSTCRAWPPKCPNLYSSRGSVLGWREATSSCPVLKWGWEQELIILLVPRLIDIKMLLVREASHCRRVMLHPDEDCSHLSSGGLLGGNEQVL